MTALRRFRGPVGVLAIAGALVGGAHAVGLRLNWSPSLPFGLYVLRSGTPVPGDLAAACLAADSAALGRERGYLGPGNCPAGSAPVLKLVGAIGGDIVQVGPRVRVNGALLQSAAPRWDRAGRPLDRFPAGLYELAPNELWLYSPSPHSWDSRFFGPIPVENIAGLVHPLWTWGDAPVFPRGSPAAAP